MTALDDIEADEILVRLEGEVNRLKKSSEYWRKEERRLQEALRQCGFRVATLTEGLRRIAYLLVDNADVKDLIRELAGPMFWKCPYCGEDCDWVVYQDHLMLCQDGYSKMPRCENCGYVPEDLVDRCPQCNTGMPKGRAL